MLLILVEVSVKVSCRSMTSTDCGHRAIMMLLILVKVSVKVACRSTTTTDCKHRAITMQLILVEVSVKRPVGQRQPQTAATELSPCYLFWLESTRAKTEAKTAGTELSPYNFF